MKKIDFFTKRFGSNHITEQDFNENVTHLFHLDDSILCFKARHGIVLCGEPESKVVFANRLCNLPDFTIIWDNLLSSNCS